MGSTITGFGAETSDIDMCVVSSAEAELDPRFEAVRNLTDLKKFLSVSGMDEWIAEERRSCGGKRMFLCLADAFEQFHLIQAKVPILRFRDTVDQIEVDLNYNNSVGIRNTHLLYCYSKCKREREGRGVQEDNNIFLYRSSGLASASFGDCGETMGQVPQH